VNRRTRLILLIVWIIIIFVLTGYPGLKTPRIKDFPIDKVYHFAAFALLGVFELRVVKTVIYFLLGFTVALFAELQQLVIPGRDFEYLDIIAGCCGLLAVFIIGKTKGLFSHGISKT
jgi:VanZ family protein